MVAAVFDFKNRSEPPHPRFGKRPDFLRIFFPVPFPNSCNSAHLDTPDGKSILCGSVCAFFAFSLSPANEKFRALGKPLGRHCCVRRNGFHCGRNPSFRLHSKGNHHQNQHSRFEICFVGLPNDRLGSWKRGKTSNLCYAILSSVDTSRVFSELVVKCDLEIKCTQSLMTR